MVQPDEVSGLPEAIAVLGLPGLDFPPDAAEVLAKAVIAVASPSILSAGFADAADDAAAYAREAPGIGWELASAWLDHVSRLIRLGPE
jgi:hypothetical protein